MFKPDVKPWTCSFYNITLAAIFNYGNFSWHLLPTSINSLMFITTLGCTTLSYISSSIPHERTAKIGARTAKLRGNAKIILYWEESWDGEWSKYIACYESHIYLLPVTSKPPHKVHITKSCSITSLHKINQCTCHKIAPKIDQIMNNATNLYMFVV